MITHISTVSVYVTDQDKAKDFYVNKLGFQLMMDAPMGPDVRWIDVRPAGAQTGLTLMKPTPEMPHYEFVKSMIGTWTTFIFAVDDINATYEELKGRGVEFLEAPAKQEWGWWAVLRDLDGNNIGV